MLDGRQEIITEQDQENEIINVMNMGEDTINAGSRDNGSGGMIQPEYFAKSISRFDNTDLKFVN